VIVVLVIVFVAVGLLAHLLLSGVALNGLRMMIHELRNPASRAAHPRIRARDLDRAPRWGMYGINAAWIGLSALVVVLAIVHWA
jgi:hypothetical protein